MYLILPKIQLQLILSTS